MGRLSHSCSPPTAGGDGGGVKVGRGVAEGVATAVGDDSGAGLSGVDVRTLVGDGGGATVAAGGCSAEGMGVGVALAGITVALIAGGVIVLPVAGEPAHDTSKSSNKKPAADWKRPAQSCPSIKLQASALAGYGHGRGGQLLHL